MGCRKSLKRHMMRHSTSTSRFYCTLCHRSYTRPVLLSPFCETNADNPGSSKPTFMCPICGLTSSFKSSLKRHMANHSKARPYQCEVCHKSFKRKDYMKQHLQYHFMKDRFSNQDKSCTDNVEK